MKLDAKNILNLLLVGGIAVFAGEQVDALVGSKSMVYSLAAKAAGGALGLVVAKKILGSVA